MRKCWRELRPFASVTVLTGMKIQSDEQVREQVRTAYAAIAKGADGCSVGCCGDANGGSAQLGYSQAEMESVPEGADLGLGCGNPHAIAALRPGDVVLDLGSGAGFDCFLASRRVGAEGRVIGVDMTPEMVAKARENAVKVEATNVEFRLGEIENLPVPDNSVDVILSNCVINLSPNKDKVFKEAFRVLKPGGRLAISDVVETKPMPDDLRTSMEAHVGCVAGAATVTKLEELLAAAGFADVSIEPKAGSGAIMEQCMPGSGDYVASAIVAGTKPGGGSCCAPSCCDGEPA